MNKIDLIIFCTIKLKGMAFTIYERQYLGVHGLLPAAVITQEQQVDRVLEQLRELPHDLSRYVLLNALQVCYKIKICLYQFLLCCL